ncbi:hypothetical protein CMK11_09925 [Candidatus Poribacteria bacterium]|nr:hypothetical protein [Candidatus Poribacteria bacterium]
MRHRMWVACVIAAHGLVLSGHALDLADVDLNGYTSFEYERQIESAAHGAGDANGSFDADLLDLVLSLRPADDLRIALDVTWEHGAATEDDYGNAALEYGFVEHTFSDALRLRAGKMFTPFGIFNEIHTAKPAFLSVKEAAPTNKPERIVAEASRFFPRWAVGIALRGDARVGGAAIDYDVMIANGETGSGNPFEEDDNVAKALAARLRGELSPTALVGVSFYRDRPGSPEVESLTSVGTEFELQRDRVRVIGEAVVGSTDRVGSGSVTQVGWFVQPSYYCGYGVTAFARVGRVDPNLDADADAGYELVTGMNVAASDHLFVKVENDHVGGSSASSLGAYPGRDYNEIKAAVVVGF